MLEVTKVPEVENAKSKKFTSFSPMEVKMASSSELSL